MNPARALTMQSGRSAPLGATLRDDGLNIAVFSAHAKSMELCVFDAGGSRELGRLPLHGPEDQIFSGFVPAAGEGLVYGLRAHGPYQPEAGHRFNPNKLLLDPHAREIVGHFMHDGIHHGYQQGHPGGARSFDARDNAATALKAVARKPLPVAPGLGNRPRIARASRLLYELHVRGFSMQMPGLPDPLRGRLAALAHPLSIDHFRRLGITTLSLLPIHHSLAEAHLARQGKPNYWGYNTLGFFCLDPRFAAKGADAAARDEEMRDTVHRLHQAGIEVLLDMVFNHSAEGDELGPTLSFRGLDNRSWYRLASDDASRYDNASGCGNTLDFEQPQVLRWALDALRHAMLAWGVDGFRFDLASVLGRGARGFDPRAPFFAALAQDPLLADAVLVAEPWDSAPGGYQVGRFPGRFLDWNDCFRDALRGYWLGRPVTRGEFARRITGSSDLFQHGGRAPTASVNFITAHDGFTLADLVSYSRKHNAANGENNRDGRDDELSENFGQEGPSDCSDLQQTRNRVRRALLASLLLAQGTPMLCAGDELGNSQGGNNNAYCQDNPTGWLDWQRHDEQLIDLVSRLTALRHSEPLLHHPRWFVENPHDAGEAGVLWLTPRGRPMQLDDWHDPGEHALACQLVPGEPQRHGLLLLFNPDSTQRDFSLPAGRWQPLFDSSADSTPKPSPNTIAGSPLPVPAHSLLLLRGVDAASEALA